MQCLGGDAGHYDFGDMKTGKEEGKVEFNLFLDLVPPGGLLDGIGLQGSPMGQIMRAAPQVGAVGFDEPTLWIVLV